MVRWLRSPWSTSADRSPLREWCPTPSPARSTGNRPLSAAMSVSTSSKRPASRNSSARTWNRASVATLDSACLVNLLKIQRHLRTLRLPSHRLSVRPPTTADPSAPVRPVSVRCQSTNSNWSIPFTNAWQITSSCRTETTAHPESLDISSFMNKLAFFQLRTAQCPQSPSGPFAFLSRCLSFPRLWSDCLSFLCNFVSFFGGKRWNSLSWWHANCWTVRTTFFHTGKVPSNESGFLFRCVIVIFNATKLIQIFYEKKISFSSLLPVWT